MLVSLGDRWRDGATVPADDVTAERSEPEDVGVLGSDGTALIILEMQHALR